ncbi:hypothetical protein AKJ16_DCAP14347 [Drosera capensis]
MSGAAHLFSSAVTAAAPSTTTRALASVSRSRSRPSFLSYRRNRCHVRCSYAEGNIKPDSGSATIDVVADIKAERLVVLGGSGFVGSAICKAAVSKGIEILSLSRSGRPSYNDPWVDQVSWVPGMYYLLSFDEAIQINQSYKHNNDDDDDVTFENRVSCLTPVLCAGDVFYVNWDEVLVGATAVVSTLGGFGNEEQMKRINGEANVVAVNAAKDYGVPKFILISVHDYNLPPFLLQSGYFTGKRKAESEVLSKYPNAGVVLRPGFIYGKRKVDGFEIPLDLIGEPLERFLRATENFTRPLSSLPASDLLLAPPVSVDDVALAVVNAIRDDDFFGIFTIEQIKLAAANVKV